MELLSKGFERSVYWKKYRTKSNNKDTTSEFRFFLKSNFVGLNRLFFLVYSNQDVSRRFWAKSYYLPKDVMIIIISSSMEKSFMTKQLIRVYKLTTGQGEDYTTGCLLDCDYIEKNNYRLIAVDLSRQ